ncbi:Adenylate kinase/UMP-CMP kinase [Carpediemonas membranifera]|uniref:Adenylate kinase/UMP-CMP kinase n=1 Tax=Carpediemonas membranifera TaxID=201153 RepID=A0A8J6AV87_9EUKA|nr:Adenylate kinase/UMP-CMP kinase [Carpediemonas membranifera]|eukprot:KAG9393365.1 Adenylate kinase/UMP-CMP kinase [Carpediemonas membranifera]
MDIGSFTRSFTGDQSPTLTNAAMSLKDYRPSVALHAHTSTNLSQHCKDTTIIMFQEILDELRAEHENSELTFPREIMWLGGAPGAGKGTNTPFICKLRGITATPIVMSDLFKTPEMRALINKGYLIDDRAAVKLLFEELLKAEYQEGCVVDGFPRTTGQAEIVRLLNDFMIDHHYRRSTPDACSLARKPVFRIVCLAVNEHVSVFRQVSRGEKAIEENAKIKKGQMSGMLREVRPTDLDVESCRKRYRVYEQETLAALNSLKSAFHYHFIDAGGAVETVQARIEEEMKYQSSLELEPETHSAIRHIPKASSLTNHIRQHLTRRLDEAMATAPEKLKEAVDIIDAEVSPMIRRHAASGKLRMVLSQPPAPEVAGLIIDVLLERGFRPLMWEFPRNVPTRIDLKTGEIICNQVVDWNLEIEWDIPRIRNDKF